MIVHQSAGTEPPDLVDDVGLRPEEDGDELLQLLLIGGAVQSRHGASPEFRLDRAGVFPRRAKELRHTLHGGVLLFCHAQSSSNKSAPSSSGSSPS